MDSQGIIRIAAALIRGADGRTLLVRKRNTDAFMQPGGKIEIFEEPVAALCRELSEELGLELAPDELTYIGRFIAPAANEPGRWVDAEVFSLSLCRPVKPGAEIEEILWVDPYEVAPVELAPLTRDKLSRCALVRAGSDGLLSRCNRRGASPERLSLPGLTGQSSSPCAIVVFKAVPHRGSGGYWIARSSRAMTAIVGGALTPARSPACCSGNARPPRVRC
jgi:8-oxo-dGTP diphosphatase